MLPRQGASRAAQSYYERPPPASRSWTYSPSSAGRVWKRRRDWELLFSATTWRTASFTLTSWTRLLREDRAVAEDRFPACQVVQGQWCADCWEDKLSIAQRFEHIVTGQLFPTRKGSTHKSMKRVP
eukprot:4259067-Pyramimonas_sp.AAC.1